MDKSLTEAVAKLAEEVGNYIKGEQKKFKSSSVEIKSLNSLVSYVDRTAEEKLVEGLAKLLPGVGFITEEGTVETLDSKAYWIIDPLDGTTNFIHGLPLFAVSIGLLQDKELLSGVVHEVGHSESFTAWKGGGAYCNGQRVQVSTCSSMANGLFATGFPYYDYGRMEAFMELLTDFFQGSRGLRRLGSAATDLAWVACGRFEGFFEYGLSAWDVSAGALLVKEAGGVICDFEGGDNYLFGGSLISANSAVFDEFKKTIQKRMVRS